MQQIIPLPIAKITSQLSIAKITSLLWYSAIILLIIAGWGTRDQHYLVAKTGIGYWFGIIGASMMLLLLVYPMRKRFSRWRFIGSVKSWFRLHMILGVGGPLIILFHSGFSLGSLNSEIAFFSMVTVSLSGLLGRILYRRVHHGLYGRKLQFNEIYINSDLPDLLMSEDSDLDFGVIDELDEIEDLLVHRRDRDNRSLRFFQTMKQRVARLKSRIGKSSIGTREQRQIFRRLKDLRSIAAFGTNEILFSYWHILHLPLFLMLILSGIVHVVVVHFY